MKNQETEKKEVAKKTSGDVQVSKMSEIAKQAHNNFEGSSVNLIVPRLMVKNEGSAVLKPYDLADGDIVDTLNFKKIVGLNEKIKVIPFHTRTVWIVSEVDKRGEEFVGYVDFTGERLPYEEDLGNGVTLKRSMGIQVLMLFVDEIEDGTAMPYAFTFKKSSANAGKKLNTIMYMKNKMVNKAPWASVIDFFSVERQHEKGEYYTIDIQQGDRESTEYEVEVVEYWYTKMVANEITVDESTGEVLE